ncbi:PD40 domain-containing protein [Candidatus Poribacteria bacterium]|nr:PD40 domain-containing protein [Candidatus Poribacteria bacterium]
MKFRFIESTLYRCCLLTCVMRLVLTSPGLAQLAETKIAFTSNRDSNYEIYVMNSDGTNPKNLTHHPADDTMPAWSPDGRKIAFRSNRDGNYEIYVMNADGTHPLRLTNHPALDMYPAWSPDGSQIAFDSSRSGDAEIYVMNTDGTNPVQLTHSPLSDSFPSWSPDGRKIAFASWRGEGSGDIYVMDADGKNPVQLTDDPDTEDAPAWSPDGRFIAFRHLGRGIFVINPNGRNLRNLAAGPRWMPRWSPDGTRLVFVENNDIYVMDADGQRVIQLTNHPATDYSPAWSPVLSLGVSPREKLPILWGEMKRNP